MNTHIYGLSLYEKIPLNHAREVCVYIYIYLSTLKYIYMYWRVYTYIWIVNI
jgi:hypothetical protein